MNICHFFKFRFRSLLSDKMGVVNFFFIPSSNDYEKFYVDILNGQSIMLAGSFGPEKSTLIDDLF